VPDNQQPKYWKNPNFWIAVSKAFSITIAAFAAAASAYSAYQSHQATVTAEKAALTAEKAAAATEKLALQDQLRQQMLAYMTEFARLVNDEDDPFSVNGYRQLKREGTKRRVEIVAGLLVGVIDLMYQREDPRVVEWAGYITGLPGPLAQDYPLETYATHPKTKAAIVRARDRAKELLFLIKSPLPDPSAGP
jgi:hypothetical protein